MPDTHQFPVFKTAYLAQYFTAQFKGMEYLLPEEAGIVEQSAPKRRADFSTGRYCARQALAKLINQQPAVLQGQGRQPVWPDGVVGSISHSDKLAGAVVALGKDIAAIGLDIETIGGVKPEMWPMIFHETEQQLILNKGSKAEIWATLLFSLKEAFYKMQYPVTGLYVDFLDVRIIEKLGQLYFENMNGTYNPQLIVFSGIRIEWLLLGEQLLSICYIVARKS